MTRMPWDPGEIGAHDSDLDAVAERLESYAGGVDASPDRALLSRIHAAIDAEPLPAAPWWRPARGFAGWTGSTRLAAAAAVIAIGVLGGFALGQLASLMQDVGTGSSPAPVVSPSPSESPTPSPSPTSPPSESPSPSPSESASPLSSATLIPPPQPTATDEDDELETPEPPDDDNSGPGGGGGGNSGPGGGGDDDD